MDTNARQQPIAQRPAAPQPQRVMTPPKPKPVQPKPAGAVGEPKIPAESPLIWNWAKAGTPLVIALVTGRELKGKLVRVTRFTFDVEDNGNMIVVHKHSVATIEKA